jgi:hypothetical protein
MSSAIEAWLEAGRHLPHAMRDFHDQKALFAAMHTLQGDGGASASTGSSTQAALEPHFNLTPAVGHAYVVDRFLWFMARRGWTLQRCRADLPFDDLIADVDAVGKARTEQFYAALRVAK